MPKTETERVAPGSIAGPSVSPNHGEKAKQRLVIYNTEERITQSSLQHTRTTSTIAPPTSGGKSRE